MCVDDNLCIGCVLVDVVDEYILYVHVYNKCMYTLGLWKVSP